MEQKKEIEDYLFKNEDVKMEKSFFREKQNRDKWSIIFEKLKKSSLKKFLKKQ